MVGVSLLSQALRAGSVPPHLFGLIKRSVGNIDQRRRARADLGFAHSDANRNRHESAKQRSPVYSMEKTDRGVHLLRHFHGALAVRVRQKQRELVSSIPRQQIVGTPSLLRQRASDRHQAFVAIGVAVEIVDAFK